MDSDNEIQGFDHHEQEFDFVSHFQPPLIQPTVDQQLKQRQIFMLPPPISTYLQTKNCPSPDHLNNIYTYSEKQSFNKLGMVKAKTMPWSCSQEKYPEQQFTNEQYKTIYSKFKTDRSNYKFYRQYAKSEYKTFTDIDNIENSSGEQDDSPSFDNIGKKKRLNFLKIDRIVFSIPKQLRFRSDFENGNLQKVFKRVNEPEASSIPTSLQTSNSTLQKSKSICQQQRKENGKNCVQSVIRRKYFLQISNDTNTIGFNQWFYFKVYNPNFQTDIKVTFIIFNINKKTISNINEVGIHTFNENKNRLEGIGWQRHFEGLCVNSKNYLKKDDTNFYHTLQFQATIKPLQIIYFALTTPYSFTKLTKFISHHQQSFQILTRTFSGNPIYMYKIGSSNAKKSILITARQHPSQSSSSFVVQGVINRLSASSLSLNSLKKKYQIFVIPMVNPDGVIHGNSRTNLLGFDINRKWQIQPDKRHSNQVYSLVHSLIQKIPPVQFLIDLHGHSKKLNTFAYFSTKKSLATFISIELAERLSWFKIEDCQMNLAPPANTLRWYMSTNKKTEKSITIQTSIHGWVDQNKIIQPFTPEKLRMIGQALVDVLGKLESQKKSTLKPSKIINFADQHESSDSDPEGDCIKLEQQQKEKQKQKDKQRVRTQTEIGGQQILNAGEEQKNEVSSPRRLRIKTCSTNFYKPIMNSSLRDKLKTEYTVQKLNLEFIIPKKSTGPRKKTIDLKFCKIKEKNMVSIRRINSNYNQLSQSISFTPLRIQEKKSELKVIPSIGRIIKRKESCNFKEKEEKQMQYQQIGFQRVTERKFRNLNYLVGKEKQRPKTKLKKQSKL